MIIIKVSFADKAAVRSDAAAELDRLTRLLEGRRHQRSQVREQLLGALSHLGQMLHRLLTLVLEKELQLHLFSSQPRLRLVLEPSLIAMLSKRP